MFFFVLIQFNHFPLRFAFQAYLALNGALHDVAIASWGIKNHYDYVRPVTAIRYMAALGQSSRPDLPGYHPGGLPLITGHSRLISFQDFCADTEQRCNQSTGFLPGTLLVGDV